MQRTVKLKTIQYVDQNPTIESCPILSSNNEKVVIIAFNWLTIMVEQ